ncbi:MAG: hypothetical protein AB7J34_05915 [Limisphaerales bacterium]
MKPDSRFLALAVYCLLRVSSPSGHATDVVAVLKTKSFLRKR